MNKAVSRVKEIHFRIGKGEWKRTIVDCASEYETEVRVVSSSFRISFTDVVFANLSRQLGCPLFALIAAFLHLFLRLSIHRTLLW